MTMRLCGSVVVLVALLSGCNSAKQDAELKEAQSNFDATVKGSLDVLQWRLDQATAAKVFDDGTQAGITRYLAFRRCHEEPPTHDKNKRICASLQQRVASVESKAEVKRAADKAAW